MLPGSGIWLVVVVLDWCLRSLLLLFEVVLEELTSFLRCLAFWATWSYTVENERSIIKRGKMITATATTQSQQVEGRGSRERMWQVRVCVGGGLDVEKNKER